jgi:flagellar FliL protein
MADEKELQMEDGAKPKSKMMLIIIIAVVVLAAGGAAAYFLLGSSSDDAMMEDGQMMEDKGETMEDKEGGGGADFGSALYVAMPRPFIFNVPGVTRERLVQIRVQLLVRGTDNEETAKIHIPSIEGALLQVFSGANADDLVTEAGKMELRDRAVTDVQIKMQELVGSDVVEQVLFTGFVMQ